MADSAAAVIERVGLTAEIARLRERIDAWVAGSPPAVRPLLAQQFQGNSKYFRPMLVFACHRAVSSRPISERVMTAAQAIEMFHNITLIVDDIVDKSPERRNMLTLSGQYEPLTAYMAAGYIDAQITRLLTRGMFEEHADLRGDSAESDSRRDEVIEGGVPDGSGVDSGCGATLPRWGLPPMSEQEIRELNRAGPVRFDLRLLGELKERLALAECIQWDSRRLGTQRIAERREMQLGLADWQFLAREDTGSMFEVCACLGARSQRFRRFGRLLGMLYHGCDDVSDVRSAKDRREQDAGGAETARFDGLGGGGDEDLDEGILTLPAALAIADDQVRKVFVSVRRSSEEEAFLRAAFKRQLPNACRELSRIREQTESELRAMHAANEGQLLRLIEEVHRLGNCATPAAILS